MRAENWSEIQAGFKGVVDTIEIKPEKAFINTLCAVNQTEFLFSDYQQPLANHPKISQTSCQE
mgnify:CR=1 FL=1